MEARTLTRALQRQFNVRRKVAGVILLLLALQAIWALSVPSLGVFVLTCLAFGFTVMLYPWIVGDFEVCELTMREREQMWPDSQYIELNDGITRYELAGPEDGPKVVLVTGLASSFFIWDGQFSALAEAGFRVLRYDNFGRGGSDRPFVEYNAATFDRQLLELLNELNWTEPVDLIGLSMGGATVAHFIDRHPERVRRYVFIAPAGLPAPTNLRGRLLMIPGLGEWLMMAFGDKSILKSLPAELGAEGDKVEQAVDAYLDQMQFHGYKRAILSTLRNNPLNRLQALYERIGSQPRLGLLIWGTSDKIVPFRLHTRMQAAIPSIRFFAVEGGSHPVCYQKPEVVNPVIVEFLSR